MTLQRQMALGAAWMISARFAVRIIGLASTLILVRLLLPSDFGLVALATAFIAGIELLKTFSFDVALIQDQNASKHKYNAAWTVNLLFSLAFAGVLLIAATPIADFYSDPRLANVIQALSLSVVIRGIENVGVVDFRKELDFRKEFIYLFLQKISGFVVTITLAFVLRNYWALVAGLITSAVAGTIASYVMHPFRPKLGREGLLELFHFSKWLFLNNLLYFIRHRSADFFLGKFGGTKAVGLFTVAYEISHLVTNELVAPINRAVFPGYAKMASDKAVLRKGYLQVMSLIAMLSIPAAAGIAVTAELLVPVILGENWLTTIPLIQILAFSGAIAILETNIGAAYIALGQPQTLTIAYGVFAIAFLTLLAILVPSHGAIGAAVASLAAGLFNIPVQLVMMKRTLGITLADVAKIYARPLLASACMYGVVSFTIDRFAQSLPQLVSLLAGIIVGIVAYVAMSLLLWRLSGMAVGPEQFVIDKFRQWRNKSLN